MNDGYLKQFKKLPDSHLVEKIHSRLERKERIHAIKQYFGFLALAVLFTFGMLMALSSTVRADVLQTLEELAGLRFDVTSHYPGDPGGEEVIITGEYLSLEEAQSRFTSPVVLPAYVPQGYQRSAEVILTPFTDPETPTLMITWENKGGNKFFLDILHCSIGLKNCGLTVGEGALEEIELNGTPAVVVHGAWNYDTQQYDSSIGTAIRWLYDENTIYTLSTWNQDMALEELVRIAESIP